MADLAQKDLAGKTPLQAAATPNMDLLARKGELGQLVVHADGLPFGSELTELSLLGYDPRKAFTGPAPLEAASLGVTVEEHDIVYRCDMVSFRTSSPQGGSALEADIKKLGPHVLMDDEAAGGIASEEARELLEAVNEQLGSETIQFYPGSGHRHLMVWVNGKFRATCANPRMIIDKPVTEFLPNGEGSDILRKIMEASLVILRDHPVNDQRREAGLKPVHCLWLWGQGRAPRLESLTERLQITGAIASTDDLHRGIGMSVGLEGLQLEASTNDYGADFHHQAKAALEELRKKDLIYVHATVPNEVSRGTDAKGRLKVLEAFDQKLVGVVMDGLPKLGAHRVLLVCDYAPEVGSQVGATPTMPFAFYEGPAQDKKSGAKGFSEAEAKASAAGIREATKLLARLCPRP